MEVPADPFSESWPDLRVFKCTRPFGGATVVASDPVDPDACLFRVGLLPGVKFDRTRSYPLDLFSPSSACRIEDLDAEKRRPSSFLPSDPFLLPKCGLLLACRKLSALPERPIPSSIAVNGGLGGASRGGRGFGESGRAPPCPIRSLPCPRSVATGVIAADTDSLLCAFEKVGYGIPARASTASPLDVRR